MLNFLEPRGAAMVGMTRLSQVEKSSVISDRGDRASGRADDGACAWTDAAARKNTDKVAALSTLTCTCRRHVTVSHQSGRLIDSTDRVLGAG
jgi:hypothetical protein